MSQKKEMKEILDHIKEKNYINFECDDITAKKLEDIVLETFPSVGILSKEEFFYEFHKVHEYLDFFASLTNHKNLVDIAIEKMQLSDLKYVKVCKLNHSQRRRLAIAREIIKDSILLLLEEPLINLDDVSQKIVIGWIEQASAQKKKIVCTSASLKQLYLLPGDYYYLDKNGLVELHNQEMDTLNTMNTTAVIEKISAKSEDKILLFNPNEIDYIESVSGKSFLHVRNSSFACNATLDELESKLKRYGFYRSHRSYLVNMQKVQEVIKWTKNSYSLKLDTTSDTNIPLSKGRIEEMKELYHF